MKRARHAVTLDVPAESAEDAAGMEALIWRTSRQLFEAGLILSPDAGHAARYLFATALAADAEARAPHDAASAEWACAFCGNLNYGGRLVCNMRKCGRTRAESARVAAAPAAPAPPPPAADSWTCAFCGNLNYGGRLVCNMRKCGRSRAEGWGRGGAPPLPWAAALPPPPMVPPPRGTMGPPPRGGVPLPPRGGMPAAGGMPPMCGGRGGAGAGSSGAEAPAPEGSWECTSCGNINFPTRTVCNRRTCKLPRPVDA
ncbi:hypothetical protein AB1Y20_012614 [Prymnesium parvum]|uniref:RanBP2-type domain-containing protein n=1 Tax=Prymnesium parvum TaxID=97485 RepID=A0AB34IL14_PRYPA